MSDFKLEETDMELGTNGTSKSTALVKVQPAQAMAYEPRSSSEAYQMATHFAKSGFLGDINTPEKAFLIMATGADLGLPATTALRAIGIVKGKPVLAADLMKAMCISRKDVCKSFRLVKSDEKIATYSAQRVDDESPTVLSFTMEDAVRAKLATKGDDSNYAKYPAVMLRRRCIAMLARELFPDIVFGVYCEEEAGEIREEARIVEAVEVETKAVDDLAQRIEAFAKRIDEAQSLEALQAVGVEIGKDPAAKQIKSELNAMYTAKRDDLNAPEPGSNG